jgi:hypothetical protein
MISDSPYLVFILGIDRRKVAAALPVKYQSVLPYFPIQRRSASTGIAQKSEAFDPRAGLEFGYSFI